MPTGLQTIRVNADIGNDEITVLALPDASATAFVTATLAGDDGDDTIDASELTVNTPLNLNGNRGRDRLIGGRGNDTVNGGPGDDLMLGGDPAVTPMIGDNTYDGGAGFNTLGILGTDADDTLIVNQISVSALITVINGNSSNEAFTNIDEARVEAKRGDDVISVVVDDTLFVAAADPEANVLRYDVRGGASSIGDRLNVIDDGLGDTIIHRLSRVVDAGTVIIAPAHPNGGAPPVIYDDVERVDVAPLNPITGQTGIDGSGQLFTFKADLLESNEQLSAAAFLGSGETINVDPTIDPGPGPLGTASDQDWYRLVAETTGTLDLQVYFQSQGTLPNGRSGLPGNGNLDVFAFDAGGVLIAGFGSNENAVDDADERIRIPVVQGQTYFLQVLGVGTANNVYHLSVVNHAPPTPYALELLDNPADGTTLPPGGSGNSDTGRSQFDNHTYDDTPTLFFRLDDGILLNDLPGNPAIDSPADEVIPIPFRTGPNQANAAGYAIAVFDEGNTLPQTGTAPQTPLGFATAVPGQQGVYTFTVPDGLALSQGSHFLSARVQMIDPATIQQTGFGPRSEPFEIVVDTTPPPVTFGTPGSGLHPDSDSGDPALASTLVDRITNDLTPKFFGRSEADAIVRAYVDADDDGALNLAVDTLIGQTVATPLDGTNQAPRGEWEITSTVNMNDPNLLDGLGFDGLRRIFVTAEDLAGNVTEPDNNSTLEIFIDTQGPQVTDVFITDVPDFHLFTLKPDTPRPTPRVDSLTIAVQDPPPRIAAFLYSALSNVPPLAPIVLSGDHSGAIPIANLAYNVISNGPGIASGQIVLSFDSPLPDDRFTLTAHDNVIDPAGNPLDGENNAAEPIGNPFFPSGDGIPGGDFIARFTIDSRPEVATWSQSVVYADINGNFVWDPEGQDNDAVNRDFAYHFGEASDAYFAGNFSPAAASVASGFDKLGAYGAFNGQYQFFLDTNDDGVGDTVGSMAFQVNAIPVAGNFSAAHPGDEIGAFDGQSFYLDVNGNNRIDAGERFSTSLRGIPVVGDFNGNGSDDLATFNNNTGIFQFDLDRNGSVDDELTFGFTGFGEIPVAGDFNLDGIDDIVVWVPKQEGQLPKESGEFHFLISDHAAALPGNVFATFSPAPLGNDLISQFGDDFALPLLGNFDPPIAEDGQGATFVGSLTNEDNPLDTNMDGVVTARDALVVINALGRGDFNQSGSPLRVVASLGGFRLDASGDGTISALDALRVINVIAQQSLLAEGERASSASSPAILAAAADSVFAELDDDEEEMLQLLALDALATVEHS